MADGITRVAVIGAGAMGAGIAQVSAMAGWPTALTDTRREALDAALSTIGRNLDGAVERGKLTGDDRTATLGRLSPAENIGQACDGADLVIEAVVEDLEIKRAVLGEAALHASARALLASNTSSLSIAAIADGLPDPERCLGLHFFD